jgi:hypothetical protein
MASYSLSQVPFREWLLGNALLLLLFRYLVDFCEQMNIRGQEKDTTLEGECQNDEVPFLGKLL